MLLRPNLRLSTKWHRNMKLQEILIVRGESTNYEGQIDIREMVREALEEMGATLTHKKKTFYGGPHPPEERWANANNQFIFVNDRLLPNDYIIIREHNIPEAAKAFRSKIYVAHPEEELERLRYFCNPRHPLRSTCYYMDGDWTWALQRVAMWYLFDQLPESLALGTYGTGKAGGQQGNMRKEILGFIERALHIPDVYDRAKILSVMHYLWWDELKPLIEKVAIKDPNELLRNKATDFLSYFDAPEPGLFVHSDEIPHWWYKCWKHDHEIALSKIHSSNNRGADGLPEIDMDDFIIYD